ncbi:enoyl-CoA hydratase/isomerase family protein [Caulobacter soli]|uniref:enoyl-CoA hydratase/isomerase family protein n=1 Tax=Caulobacter soli TaxID=2708539 RepID=UPI0013EE32BB|nr:enoyl-CoA hydratase-related protein [Caulobacter soli]
MTATVLLARDGAVATITLNRPEVGNALDMPTARALMEAVIACDEDDAVRCVVLTGAGKLFCAGGDVAAFAGAGDQLPAFLKEITVYVHAAVARLMRMNKPVVTAINGSAAGAGVGLAILGDVALAGPRAQFALAYGAIGLSPDGGATWLLPRLIGLRRAQELCLRNRRVTAEEAAAMGLVTRVVEDDLMAEAMTVAQDLARSATPALAVTRRLLLDSAVTSLEAQLDAESRGIAALARTAEGKEGVAAFLEKRAPDFTGGK